MFRKYQTGGSSEIDYEANYKAFVRSQEATDAVMKNKKSMILKPDGKTYYKALENGIYYPYKDDGGNQTIGFGRHTSTLSTDYPKGISIAKANEFLDTDVTTNFDNAKRKYDIKYGTGEFNKLKENEQYMLTDYVYNLGYLYPKFTEAIRSGNTETALEEYKRYQYTNKGKDNETKRELGRNTAFLNTYLNPWVNEILNPVEQEITTPIQIDSIPVIPADNTAPGLHGPQFQMGGTMISNPSMYKQMQQMQQLPGGTMMNIPGSDAVEFRGQTHKQGGILMDEETEVEDGETMDKIVMKDGQNKDYFFSSYLKKNGRSYADIHKEILSRGGNQEEINYLAAMQEKAAKRSPNKIQTAGLGGITKYAEGGFDDDLSKREIKEIQKERYAWYEINGGTLSFRKWNRENPFDIKANYPEVDYVGTPPIENKLPWEEGYDPEYDAHYTPEVARELETWTIGLRKDFHKAYDFNAEYGDGYSICKSGNCENGTGVIYTYWTPNPDEKYPASFKGDEKDYVIGMYEGEFIDGFPAGQGKFTWNDVNQAEELGIPFVDWGNFYEGTFEKDDFGHPQLTSGVQDYSDGQGWTKKTGIFKDGKLDLGTEEIGSDQEETTVTNIEDGQNLDGDFSDQGRNNLVQQGIFDKEPFQYSQGDIDPKYTAMANYDTYTQPTKAELNALGYNSFDEFRADYERYTDAGYDWKNVTHWGKQHQLALDELTEGIGKGFVPTGTYTPPPIVKEDDGSGDPFIGPQGCPCEDGTMDIKCCEDTVEESGRRNWLGRLGQGLGDVPPLAYLSGLAQLAPAAYAFTHKQPDPEQVPFISGVTSPIVPGRLRADKLSHINMNLQRSKLGADLREMNQFIDTSGGGPANLINRMAAWGKKHEGDMQIAQTEKQFNNQIENQNVAIENQTNLHNLKLEQEAALGNMQVQAAEAQRENEVAAINTAARNKIRDDEEYMKYAGIISGAQGVGNLFGDMLAYKGDMLRAKGYGIEGTTNRMLLRRHLGGTLYAPNGAVFCENCTQEDIANYENTYNTRETRYY